MRILIISLGAIGRRHLDNTRRLLPSCRVCVWRHQPNSQDVQIPNIDIVYTLEDAMAFQPEAIIVASPAPFHLDGATPFLQKHLPVFLEKPLTDNIALLPKFQQLCTSPAARVMVGYVLRFHPVLLALKDALDRGVVGRVYTASLQVGQYLPDWRKNVDYRNTVSANSHLGGGALLELSHELDYARWLFGDPQSVMASVLRLSPLQIDVEDSAHVLYEYPDKRVAIALDFLQRVPKRTLQIIGSEGTLEVDILAETLCLYSPEYPEGKVMETATLEDFNHLYLRQFDLFFAWAFSGYRRQFPDCGNTAYPATIEDGIAAVKIIAAARQSHHSGQRVQL